MFTMSEMAEFGIEQVWLADSASIKAEPHSSDSEIDVNNVEAQNDALQCTETYEEEFQCREVFVNGEKYEGDYYKDNTKDAKCSAENDTTQCVVWFLETRQERRRRLNRESKKRSRHAYKAQLERMSFLTGEPMPRLNLPKRRNETEEAAAKRRKQNAERVRKKRLNETPEQSAERRRKMAIHRREARKLESAEATAERLRRDAERRRERRLRELKEAAAEGRGRNASRKRVQRSKVKQESSESDRCNAESENDRYSTGCENNSYYIGCDNERYYTGGENERCNFESESHRCNIESESEVYDALDIEVDVLLETETDTKLKAKMQY